MSVLHIVYETFRHELCQVRKEIEQRDTFLINLEEKLHRMEATEQHPQSEIRDTDSQTVQGRQAKPQPGLHSPPQIGPSSQAAPQARQPNPPKDNTTPPALHTAPCPARVEPNRNRDHFVSTTLKLQSLLTPMANFWNTENVALVRVWASFCALILTKPSNSSVMTTWETLTISSSTQELMTHAIRRRWCQRPSSRWLRKSTQGVSSPSLCCCHRLTFPGT